MMNVYFDKTVTWVSEGIIGVEFCEYDTKNCPSSTEYCMCKNFDFNADEHPEPDTENN